jgi:hypothetical protein
MNTLKPLILVTNDGVSAPDSSRDGRNRRRFSSRRQAPKRHGSCHNNKQHLIFKQNLKENDVIEEYCSGTVDCVKLAVNEILKESRICACLALIMDLTLPSM